MDITSQNKESNDFRESVDTTKPAKGFRKILAFFGPAYLVSVGYMDPGNWATDLQGGAQFGYKLIWVLLMSNLMALLLQSLAARLGIVRRRDLAQANREAYPPVANFCLYILAELAIAACDLAEVLGMAIGLNLLTGLPILGGVCVTVLDTFLLFYLQKMGMRKMEAFIVVLISIIGGSFLIELLFAKPHLGDVVKGFVPTKLNHEALYVAIGIIGATVMPHNLYLHSSLVQTRKIDSSASGVKRAIKFNLWDSTIALNAAFLVNAAILVLAGAIFFTSGHKEVAKIEDAYRLLSPMLGSKLAPALFAIALIAAGQSSTVTGTLAGQIVMEGYLHLRINPLLRRLLTRLLAIVPAVVVILIFGDRELDDLLIFSQVILSLQLGFAVIPLIHFVSDKKTMGDFAIGTWTRIAAWTVAAILIYLNSKYVTDEIILLMRTPGHLFWKIFVSLLAAAFIWLFLVMTFFPLSQRKRKPIAFHGEKRKLEISGMSLVPIQKIAIALDFTNKDERLIAYALRQGGIHAEYLLIHIVETAPASYFGDHADDLESRSDKEQIGQYAHELEKMGYRTSTQLGYLNRVKEIVRIVTESHANMLVVGSHKHTGIKDWIYGETVDQVRHKLSVPVLIVNE